MVRPSTTPTSSPLSSTGAQPLAFLDRVQGVYVAFYSLLASVVDAFGFFGGVASSLSSTYTASSYSSA
jgi:hypothetical protein